MSISRQKAYSSAFQKKIVLLINLIGKGLTQEINGDWGSIRWSPEGGAAEMTSTWSHFFLFCLFVVVVVFHIILLILENRRSSQGLGIYTSCIPPLDPLLCFLNMKGWQYIDNTRQCTMKFQKMAPLISFALLIKLLVTLYYDTRDHQGERVNPPYRPSN